MGCSLRPRIESEGPFPSSVAYSDAGLHTERLKGALSILIVTTAQGHLPPAQGCLCLQGHLLLSFSPLLTACHSLTAIDNYSSVSISEVLFKSLLGDPGAYSMLLND